MVRPRTSLRTSGTSTGPIHNLIELGLVRLRPKAEAGPGHARRGRRLSLATASASGLDLSQTLLNSVDREPILTRLVSTDSSRLYWYPYLQQHLPLVGCLDLIIDESRRESRRVTTSGRTTESRRAKPRSPARAPWRGGHLFSMRTDGQCSGGYGRGVPGDGTREGTTGGYTPYLTSPDGSVRYGT